MAQTTTVANCRVLVAAERHVELSLQIDPVEAIPACSVKVDDSRSRASGTSRPLSSNAEEGLFVVDHSV